MGHQDKVFSKVDALGNWMLYLPTPPFDKNAPLDGYTIDVTDGISEIKISDVLIGEVWLASGQSNMVWSMNQPPYVTIGVSLIKLKFG